MPIVSSSSPRSRGRIVAGLRRFQPEDVRAAEFAARLADARDFELTLVYALPPILGPLPAGTQAMAQRAHLDRAGEQLHELARSIGQWSDLPRTAVREGELDVVLEAEVRECRADLIVMRTDEVEPWRSGFANPALRRLVGQVDCPVLGVPTEGSLPDTTDLNVLVPARNASSALHVYQEAAQVLALGGGDSRIRLLKLRSKDVPDKDIPETGDHDMELQGTEFVSDFDSLREFVAAEAEGLSASAAVGSGSAVKAARMERRRCGADLIAVRSDTWNSSSWFRRSALDELWARARCPVLAV